VGPRTIIVVNTLGETVASADISLTEEGQSREKLGLEIPPGVNMRLTTDGGLNQSTFGFAGPRLQRSDSNVSYPYIVDDVVILKESEFGTNWYYYFYDWQISVGDICESERAPVEITVGMNTNTENLVDDAVKVFPNPSDGHILIDYVNQFNGAVSVEVVDVTGSTVLNQRFETAPDKLDLSTMVSGIYVLKMKTAGAEYLARLVKY